MTSKPSETAARLARDERSATTDLHERRLELVSDAVSGLTHDLNNTLSSIANYAELCGLPETPASKREEFARRVLQLVEEGARKLARLKRVASAGSCLPAPARLDELVALALAASETTLRRAGLGIERADDAEAASRCVEVAYDDAVHALLGLLDAGRAAALAAGLPRGAKLALHVERAAHTASVVLALPRDASIDALQLSSLDALAARAGASLEGPEASVGSLRLVFTAAEAVG